MSKDNTPYRPLPRGLKIQDSPLDGQGLFATKDIESGEWLGITHHYLWEEIVLTRLGGFINNSDDPNCKLVRLAKSSVAKIETVRKIKNGEELTLKYTSYDVGEKKGKA